uniref:Transposase n=1 Tax=Heterorhabditis bacteriophora TaxID=37862 RepID=A0A1I7XA26_HETBA
MTRRTTSTRQQVEVSGIVLLKQHLERYGALLRAKWASR